MVSSFARLKCTRLCLGLAEIHLPFDVSQVGRQASSLPKIILEREKAGGAFGKGNMIYLKDSKLKIGGSKEVAQVFQDLLVREDGISQDKEHFYVMHLDIRSRVKMVELVTIGTLNSSVVHPRETFRRAVVEGAASIIIAHNHPSGETDPSDEDTKVTKQMFEAGNILGITMLDHIIFSKDDYYSFRNNGR